MLPPLSPAAPPAPVVVVVAPPVVVVGSAVVVVKAMRYLQSAAGSPSPLGLRMLPETFCVSTLRPQQSTRELLLLLPQPIRGVVEPLAVAVLRSLRADPCGRGLARLVVHAARGWSRCDLEAHIAREEDSGYVTNFRTPLNFNAFKVH